MDGLRLALIVVGVVVVVAVYLWSARRRRIEREAGEFDSYGAWSGDSPDPLADDEARTQPNPLSPRESRRDAGAADRGDDAAREAQRWPQVEPAQNVLDGIDAIEPQPGPGARREPKLGSVEEVPQAADARPAAGRSDASQRAGTKPVRGRRAPPKKPAAPTVPPREDIDDEPELVVVLNVMAREERRFAGAELRAALEEAGLEPGEMQLYHFRAETQPPDTPPIFSALNAVKPGTLDPDEMDALETPGIALVLRLPGLERPSEAFELMYGAAARIAERLDGRLCDETRSTLTKQVVNHLRERIAEYVRRRRLGS